MNLKLQFQSMVRMVYPRLCNMLYSLTLLLISFFFIYNNFMEKLTNHTKKGMWIAPN